MLPVLFLVMVLVGVALIPLMIFSGDVVTAGASNGIYYGAELNGFNFVFDNTSTYQFPFVPTGDIRISSGFGYRYLYGKREYHNALDFPLNQGTPILASEDGEVEHAGPKGGYGNLVMINHEGSYQTRYAHLSSVAVTAGERVTRGQVIAYSGNTGRSTGPHLHYEVRYNGVAVDPSHFISLRPDIPNITRTETTYRVVSTNKIETALNDQLKGYSNVIVSRCKEQDINSLLVVALLNNLPLPAGEQGVTLEIARIKATLDQCPVTANPLMYLNRLQEKEHWWLKVLKEYTTIKE